MTGGGGAGGRTAGRPRNLAGGRGRLADGGHAADAARVAVRRPRRSAATPTGRHSAVGAAAHHAA
jgi:hypothetical protein